MNKIELAIQCPFRICRCIHHYTIQDVMTEGIITRLFRCPATDKIFQAKVTYVRPDTQTNFEHPAKNP